MNFPWDNVFEYFKDRRCAALFLLALGLSLVMLILGAISFEALDSDYLVQCAQAYWPAALAGAAPAMLWLVWRGGRRLRARRGRRYEILPLSRDEMSKARSKLMKAKP